MQSSVSKCQGTSALYTLHSIPYLTFKISTLYTTQHEASFQGEYS